MAEIDINGFAAAVARELAAYSEEVAEAVDKCSEEVAAEGAEKLRGSSPERTGAYAKSWEAAPVSKKKGNSAYRIRNRKHYQLTHLLEYGHAIKGGSRRTTPQPHIKQVETWAQEELPERIERRLGQ